MKSNIKDVFVHNWKPPGESWWEDVKAKPTEPLIDATIRLTLSWEDYKVLLGIKDGEETPDKTIADVK